MDYVDSKLSEKQAVFLTKIIYDFVLTLTPIWCQSSGVMNKNTQLIKMVVDLHSIAYRPVHPPCGDNTTLAIQGERLMFRHCMCPAGIATLQVFIAPKNVECAGWVVGVL